jgi:hypothetical protein
MVANNETFPWQSIVSMLSVEYSAHEEKIRRGGHARGKGDTTSKGRLGL